MTKGERKRFIAKSCLRKQRYPDETTVGRYLDRMVSTKGTPDVERLHFYHCNNCMGYHIGHSNR